MYMEKNKLKPSLDKYYNKQIKMITTDFIYITSLPITVKYV